MATLRIERLLKRYGAVTAVAGIDLAVADREFVVLVGPSGCGKSTTLRMIAGLESVTRGTLSIGDRVVNDVPANQRDIAMVFQNYALYPHMTVYENMAFALKLRNVARAEIEQRVRAAAGILSIEGMLDRKPRQLSGGQRQRVAVGRAIVRQPQAFLFDEPLSNLDAKLRVQMRKEISRLHRQLGATMIYVTHDQVEAMTMGDRIVVMSAGQIQQIGTPLELYEHPANQFVAGFIGSPAMNMWRGMVREQDGRAIFASDGFQLDVGSAPGVPRDRDIVLGLRPENIYYAAGPYVPSPAAEITTSIDVIEPMGNETLLYTRAGAADIVARIAPQEIPDVDEPIRLAVDLNRLHYFDAVTGERVSQ